jgi:hypothetical protein
MTSKEEVLIGLTVGVLFWTCLIGGLVGIVLLVRAW